MSRSSLRYLYGGDEGPHDGALPHGNEIGVRDFPRSRRGFDPDAVRAWSRTVADAFKVLEEDLARALQQRDRLTRAIERSQERPARAGLRAVLADLRLRRGLFGYRSAHVERILEDSMEELARLETRAALLEAENAELRDRVGPSALRESLQAMQAEIDIMRDRLRRIESPDGSAREPGRIDAS